MGKFFFKEQFLGYKMFMLSFMNPYFLKIRIFHKGIVL